MGATITDAVLQAGLRYETVVWLRVQHVRGIPEAATTSGFLSALRERGGAEVVRWTHQEKLGRMEALAGLLQAHGIEDESQLHAWLGGGEEECRAHVAELAGVRGMGPKTIEYLKILCGARDTAAPDVHLFRFLEQAGTPARDHAEAQATVREAAAALGVTAAQLDHSIWTYMSKAGKTW